MTRGIWTMREVRDDRHRCIGLCALSTAIRTTILTTATVMLWMSASSLLLAAPLKATHPDLSQQGTGSAAARQDAIASIPMDALSDDARAKVESVLSNITVFRRLPVRVVNCDPDLYLFLVRHPDVIVNTWEVLGIAQLQLRQTGPETYRATESDGTAATFEYLYHSNDTQIVYGEWNYTGPLLARKINGRCLAVLKTGYVREADGRYYVTVRLDGFLSVEPGGVELLTKTLHPLVVKNADINFIQTVAFIGSLSRTAEVNNRGMQRLASKLTHIQPGVRDQLSQVITGVGQRSAMGPLGHDLTDSSAMARRSDGVTQR